MIVIVPFPAIAKLPKDLFDTVAQGVAVVDTGNYPGLRDPHIPEIDAGMPHSARSRSRSAALPSQRQAMISHPSRSLWTCE